MNIVTSVTVFNDAIGKRMSVSYSTIDDTTGKVVSDNNRLDRVLIDSDAINIANSLAKYAQEFIDSTELTN